MLPIDLAVSFGPLTLKNPLVAASGCFGYGVEYADVVDLASLGAVAVKGLFLEERQGHVPPRIVETPSGMLNAIGLQGIGVRRFIDEKLPPLCERGAVVIVNICGSTVNEYAELAQILSDGISLVNTFLAMAIDIETRRPRLSNVVGGLSGPAIRPIAVRMVYQCRQAVSIPIMGMGGIMTADDVIEFLIAGADVVQVGTANFVDPFIWPKLLTGLTAYLERHDVSRVSDLVGTIDLSKPDIAWTSS